jgi:hypothetical protein
MEEGEDGRERGCMEGQMVRVREGAWEGEG